jgi:nitrite reductase/ring-hydroxylating ferredoxin subunit
VILSEYLKPEPICASVDLKEGELGVRFPVEISIGVRCIQATGFVIRFAGEAVAYLNQCAHVAVELDWRPGEFFDADGLYLLCSTHGAAYRPEDGFCVSGPCAGKTLLPIRILEVDGVVSWLPNASLGVPQQPSISNDLTNST